MRLDHRRAELAWLLLSRQEQPSKLGSTKNGAVCSLMLVVTSMVTPAYAQESRVLDDFSDPSQWRVVTSNQITASIRQVDGANGKALCLDYDFNGVSGYAGIQRDIELDYPQNYRFDFKLRGDSPANDLQFKVVDASGDNVWWVNKPKYAYPKDWTPVRYKQRHISKAWGPGADQFCARVQSWNTRSTTMQAAKARCASMS